MCTQIGLGKNWRAFCLVWRPKKWWNYMCSHTRVRIHVHAYMFTHTCVRIHVYTGRSWKKLAGVLSCVTTTKVMKLMQCSTHNTQHVCAYMCTHTCARIHVYAYMCTHTCVRIHVYTDRSSKKLASVLSCLTIIKVMKLHARIRKTTLNDWMHHR